MSLAEDLFESAEEPSTEEEPTSPKSETKPAFEEKKPEIAESEDIQEILTEEEPSRDTSQKESSKPIDTSVKSGVPNIEEDKDGSEKIVRTFFGLKGDGKTAVALSHAGTIAALSFDQKTTRIKKKMFNDNGRIKVFNPIVLYDSSTPDRVLESSDTLYRALDRHLDKLGENTFDWILVDGLEMVSRTCEMVMRYKNGLQPYEGIANRNLWKHRKDLMEQIHRKSLRIARKGLIYTTYTQEKEIKKDGETVEKKDLPQWLGIAEKETDDVIRVFTEMDKDEQKRFFIFIESSKTDLETGKRIDVTGLMPDKTFNEIVKG